MRVMDRRTPGLWPLPPSFFARPTERVARDLLGKVLASTVRGEEVGGRIVETEAYLGADDPGSHAATKGMTKRNAVMYGPPAHAYVYFTYGNHYMLNLVCEPEGTAGAVLVRAVEPLWGLGTMRRRRGCVPDGELADGPGKTAQAFGLDLSDNGVALGAGRVAVHDAPTPAERVLESGRVGLSAGHGLPLRFYLEGVPFVSKGRTGPPQRKRAEGTGRRTARCERGV